MRPSPASAITALVGLFLFVPRGPAFAAGFEKGIMIGARGAGLAGIATPYATGSEALYFNPAGLLADKSVQDVSINVSPTMPAWTAPVGADNATSTSETKTIVPLGLMYARNLSERLALGIGSYASAGTYASFKNVAVPGTLGSGEARTDLRVNEIGLGASYRVGPGVKVGVVYRIVVVGASLKTFVPIPGGVANPNLNDLHGTSYTGFKLGAQWKYDEQWDFGFTMRSNVPFKLTGNAGGQVMTAAGDQSISQSAIAVASTLPDAYQVGAEYKADADWHVFGELGFTAYSRVRNLQTTGMIGPLKNVALPLQFKDQWQYKVAAEYAALKLPIRFGYAYTSQVASSAYAMPGLVPPGPANTLTLGTGYAPNDRLNFNGAVEYTSASGTGKTPARLGTYAVRETALHLGADYQF